MNKEKFNILKNWKYFGLVYLIQVLIIIILTWNSKEIEYSNQGLLETSIAIIQLVIAFVIIKKFKWFRLLTFREKVIPLIGLIITQYITIFFINVLNIYDRGILSQTELIDGLVKTGIYEIVVFILSLAIIALTKNKINVSQQRV